ncbi:hypothetical protein G7Y89_g13899 [Cudoniella acicularis]|uniref:Uncharacterized protein n=1 Tax=Cudoniella acicularis TaxID=354080 RepID=A0A8H4R617_9HELO|nr:hypothetical protein G7Y89_g13899 [Cudoniella acicularis]
MLLVPLGTLTVTTGTYVPQTGGWAVMGMLTHPPGEQIMILDVMDTGEVGDSFASTVVSNIKTSPPIPSKPTVYAPTWEPRMSVWTNTTEFLHGILNTAPYAGTLFFAVGIDQSTTASVPDDKTGLSLIDTVWVSHQVYTDCERTPGQNVTRLDTEGLDYLTGQMTAVPWLISNQSDSVFNMGILTAPLVYWPGANNSHQLRVPALQNYTNLFGVVAQSIAIATTAGYYGTVEVPTVGTPEREVYIARTYMIAIVFLPLLAVSCFGTAHLVQLSINRLPFRKASFLTIASATKGLWWDRELSGTSAMPESRLRRRYGRSVMFGVNVKESGSGHVGLAPVVREIEEEGRYE